MQEYTMVGFQDLRDEELEDTDGGFWWVVQFFRNGRLVFRITSEDDPFSWINGR
ncbi:MAG: hypothetical protein LBS56_00125 [Propionibacteriaceae bacterium]|jgi:hypothetical protein|nr:hypothetical protein [Propionibacteriaceae bacterium]